MGYIKICLNKIWGPIFIRQGLPAKTTMMLSCCASHSYLLLTVLARTKKYENTCKVRVTIFTQNLRKPCS